MALGRADMALGRDRAAAERVTIPRLDCRMRPQG